MALQRAPMATLIALRLLLLTVLPGVLMICWPGCAWR
jgi:hypothetical protein